MTSVKVKFRPSTVDGKEGRLYYQIIHNSTVRFINTPCKVFPSEWDGKREVVIRPSASADDRRGAVLQRVQEQLTLGRMRLRKIIMSLDDSGLDYTVDDVAAHFREWAQQPTFFAFMRGEHDTGPLVEGKPAYHGMIEFSGGRFRHAAMLQSLPAFFFHGHHARVDGVGFLQT